MTTLEINESLNTRTLSKYFKNSIKKANYLDDLHVKFPADSNVDLAGLQILYAMKKELIKNNKNLTIEGLNNLFIEYLNINDK